MDENEHNEERDDEGDDDQGTEGAEVKIAKHMTLPTEEEMGNTTLLIYLSEHGVQYV